MIVKYFNKKWDSDTKWLLYTGNGTFYRAFMECDLIPLLIMHFVSFLSSIDLAGALLTLINPLVISTNKVRHLLKALLCHDETQEKTAWWRLIDVWCPSDSEELILKEKGCFHFSGTGPSISGAIWPLPPYTLIGWSLSPSVWRARGRGGPWSCPWRWSWEMSTFWAVCVPLPRCICFTRCLTSGSIGMPSLLLCVYLQYICYCVNAKQQSKW